MQPGNEPVIMDGNARVIEFRIPSSKFMMEKFLTLNTRTLNLMLLSARGPKVGDEETRTKQVCFFRLS